MMAWTTLRITVLWFNLVLYYVNCYFTQEEPAEKIMEVNITQGNLLGLSGKTRLSNKPFYKFLGVPYAMSPTEDLRFKPPVEHPGWSGTLRAFSDGNCCVQYSHNSKQVVGSEDCLYLNIFVPPKEEHDESKAVMVYIHDGMFLFGSVSEQHYSPDYLLDENVIVVTVNFRLNVFGFLNLDIEECPGNMGLKDQRFAIKWVRENISAFGGDADNITIFGSDSGASSVHGHILSPQSRGLFQKAIMQSGCMLSFWALNEKHNEAASSLVTNFRCERTKTEEIVQCLKSIPANDLLTFSMLMGKNNLLKNLFIPSVESDAISYPFLPVHPEVLMESASPVPVIIGLTNLEGLIGLNKVRIEQLRNCPTTKTIDSFLNGSYSEENLKKIMTFYFRDCNLQSDKTRLENIINLRSDVMVVKDFHRAFEYLLNRNVTPVYNYEFIFDGKINWVKNVVLHKQVFGSMDVNIKEIRGACHADDLSYLFYSKFSGLLPEPDSSELRMCKTLSKLWSNFAKNGNPNSRDLKFVWETTSLNNRKYLSIDGDNTKMVDGLLYKSRVNLWKDIKRK